MGAVLLSPDQVTVEKAFLTQVTAEAVVTDVERPTDFICTKIAVFAACHEQL